MKKKKKKKKKLKARRLPVFLTLSIIIFLTVSGIIFFQIKFDKNKYVSANRLSLRVEKNKPKNTATSSAVLISVSPSPSKAPVEEKNVGFCLNVPVLLYHHIQPIGEARVQGHAQLTVDSGYFDTQVKYLVDRGYRTISAEELVNSLLAHTQIPGKPIVITMDDGYSDIYNYAFPVAKKYGIIINLMIPTGLVNNGGYITWDNLREMTGSGLVYSYDHTWSHMSLGNASNEKATSEIMTAKKQLEDNLGKPVKIFAYPYGSSSQRIVDILKSNGFTGAFSTNPGFMQCDSFVMGIRRNRIGNVALSYYGL